MGVSGMVLREMRLTGIVGFPSETPEQLPLFLIHNDLPLIGHMKTRPRFGGVFFMPASPVFYK